MLFIAGLSVSGSDARERVGGVVTGRGDPQERALAVAQSGGGGTSESSPGCPFACELIGRCRHKKTHPELEALDGAEF